MVPMCTFSFFFFELVPLFVGVVIFAAGNVQTDFSSDEGVGFVFCVFCVVDVITSGFEAITSGLVFTGVGGFEAVSFFERFI